jgi:hypothetical protein
MAEAAQARSGLLECPHQDALIDQIRKAINDIISIHTEELQSVISGHLEPRDVSVDNRLRELRELKALLMERLQRHRAEHGC